MMLLAVQMLFYMNFEQIYLLCTRHMYVLINTYIHNTYIFNYCILVTLESVEFLIGLRDN